MSRNTYTLDPDERAYGVALQDALEAVKVALARAFDVPEACRSNEDRYRSQVSTLAEMVTDLSDFHKDIFTLQPKEKKEEE